MSVPTDAPASIPARRGRQLGLRGLLLLVVAAALAASIAVNRQRVAELAPRIAQLEPVARRLEVADPRQLAAVARFPDSFDDQAWDVHIPAGGDYRLCVATTGIEESGLATPDRAAPIAPGRHRLTLISKDALQGTRFVVLDGAERLLTVDAAKRWQALGRSHSMFSVGDSIQSPADLPLVLHRRRYAGPTPTNPRPSPVPPGPAEGVLFWIEPAGGGKPAPGPAAK